MLGWRVATRSSGPPGPNPFPGGGCGVDKCPAASCSPRPPSAARGTPGSLQVDLCPCTRALTCLAAVSLRPSPGRLLSESPAQGQGLGNLGPETPLCHLFWLCRWHRHIYLLASRDWMLTGSKTESLFLDFETLLSSEHQEKKPICKCERRFQGDCSSATSRDESPQGSGCQLHLCGRLWCGHSCLLNPRSPAQRTRHRAWLTEHGGRAQRAPEGPRHQQPWTQASDCRRMYNRIF